MAKRGHDRTPEECHNKTRAMRIRYRQFLDHNSRPGNRRISCPYFMELHQILKGEGLLRPRGEVASDITFRDKVPVEGLSQDPFCSETVNLEDIRPDDPLEKKEAEETAAEDFIVPNTIIEEPGPSHRGNSPPPEHHAIQEEPGQLTTARRKRLYGLYAVAEKIMEQSDRQHAAQLDQMDSHHADYMEARRQEMLESREDREMLREAIRRHDEVLKNCSQSLSTLTDLLERELQNRQRGDTSAPVNRGGGRGKRESAGCPRERLSP